MNKPSLDKQVEDVAKPWRGSPYYEDAEKWTYLFWDSGTVFRRLFERMDHSVVLELACGWGRHTERCLDFSDCIWAMDVLPENLMKTESRLSKAAGVDFHTVKCDGHSFRPISDSSITAIFCYDAMVHFSPDIIRSYLHDANRVLADRGMALFHHSNYRSAEGRHFGLNPHARNHLDFAEFELWSAESGMEILESVVIPWGGVEQLDRVTLLQKR